MPYLPAHAKRELDFPGTLARGASGIKARRVQEWLTFHRCATGIDGSFGPATEVAVRAFQSQTGLPETGKVDEDTWGLLVDPLCQALSTAVAPEETLDTAVLRIAEAHLLQHPLELGGDNRGPWVRVSALPAQLGRDPSLRHRHRCPAQWSVESPSGQRRRLDLPPGSSEDRSFKRPSRFCGDRVSRRSAPAK